MIAVTRYDGSSLLINLDVIVAIDRTPDTVVVLTNGDAVHVRETPEELVQRILQFKRELAAGVAG